MLILVTGASKGIGFEMVKQFSRMPGILVIAVSRNISTLSQYIKNSNSHAVLAVKADITLAKDRKKIAAVISKLQMPLSALVHNAGSMINKPFAAITEKELESVYRTNVFAPYLLTQILLPHMKGVAAHVVNISSMGGFQGSSKFPGLSAYSSSKSALSGLTECLAEELKPEGISVNCLAIGAVQTEMLARAFPGYTAPLKPGEMAAYICDFALNGRKYFNGKIIPVSSTTP